MHERSTVQTGFPNCAMRFPFRELNSYPRHDRNEMVADLLRSWEQARGRQPLPKNDPARRHIQHGIFRQQLHYQWACINIFINDKKNLLITEFAHRILFLLFPDDPQKDPPQPRTPRSQRPPDFKFEEIVLAGIVIEVSETGLFQMHKKIIFISSAIDQVFFKKYLIERCMIDAFDDPINLDESISVNSSATTVNCVRKMMMELISASLSLEMVVFKKINSKMDKLILARNISNIWHAMRSSTSRRTSACGRSLLNTAISNADFGDIDTAEMKLKHNGPDFCWPTTPDAPSASSRIAKCGASLLSAAGAGIGAKEGDDNNGDITPEHHAQELGWRFDCRPLVSRSTAMCGRSLLNATDAYGNDSAGTMAPEQNGLVRRGCFVDPPLASRDIAPRGRIFMTPIGLKANGESESEKKFDETERGMSSKLRKLERTHWLKPAAVEAESVWKHKTC